MRHLDISNNKKTIKPTKFSTLSLSSNKKLKTFLGKTNNGRNPKATAAWIDLIQLLGNNEIQDFDDDINSLPSSSSCYSLSSILEPNRPYTVGRSASHAHFIFKNPNVSKQHCQILFDDKSKKLYLLNGALLFSHSRECDSSCIVSHYRSRLIVVENNEMAQMGISCCECTYKFKTSLNGLFVNGVKVNQGLAVELSVGDEVILTCGNRNAVCGSRYRVGFIVRRIVYQEEVVIPGCEGFQFDRPSLVRPLLSGKVNKRVFAMRVSDSESPSSDSDEVFGRAKSLAARCKRILRSNDPVSCILKCVSSYSPIGGVCDDTKSPGNCEPEANLPVLRQQTLCFEISDIVKSIDVGRATVAQSTDVVVSCENGVRLQPTVGNMSPEGPAAAANSTIVDKKNASASALVDMDGKNPPHNEAVRQKECLKDSLPPPGKNFYLNRLESVQQNSSSHQNVVSLLELLHPVDSISRMFIATFTSDIGWFLSYCNIPSHLPITLACHNTERCWSSDPAKRYSVPYPDFPNLVVVYPPFPEAIAFGKDRKRQGVACHHPKLIILQREDTIRVIITSANLVAKQWNDVTNTIWWQDFPCRNSPDCTSLFNQAQNRDSNSYLESDFAAQLAGFMATLVIDVPSQANWIVELTKYDFTGANVYLVASVPGVHSYRSPSPTLPAYKSKCGEKFFGSIEASVVGLSHLFRTAADSNGVQLKKLAGYIGKTSEKGCGMLEIVLRRDKNVQADANAVSVLVPNPMDLSNRDCVQLGFLPRTVAKWVSPLWDIGFFRFYGYVCSRDALAAAFGENSIKVQLILHVSQGPHFHNIPKMMEAEHVVAFCSLIASVHRCTGLWRLEEVLHQYKWPEHLESDFIYGSSSIGTSVGAQFLAAFSSAAGKKSQQLFDSEESDPEWGCWNASDELKHPSIRIIFPTIERLKSAHCGILPSKRLLCFSEKTWQRLKTVDILHDAIPHPMDRVGYPMHVKVARRRFQSKVDASSFGWIYCGSHNMSAAAWGRQISGPEKGCFSGLRLHVCNYELGVIFVFPPPEGKGSSPKNSSSLDDIHLPFVVPPPVYGPRDRPATMRAMREALAELANQGGGALHTDSAATEELEEEVPDEEDEVEVINYVAQEEEEEKVYADVLWNEVDSPGS